MNTKNKLNLITAFVIAFVLVITPFVVYAVNPNLTDISNHWAKDYITVLVKRGIISGYNDGTFRPDNPIKVSEFTKLIIVAISEDVGNSTTGNWYDNYINKAIELKIIVPGEFETYDRNITRQEMARMVVRALKLDESALALNKTNNKTKFADDSKILKDLKGYIIVASDLNIINGYPSDNTFRPDRTATRAEATKMLFIMLDKLNESNTEKLIINGMEVKTSHQEIIPHIKKAIEIVNEGDYGYVEIGYSPEYNTVYINLYDSIKEIQKPIWEPKNSPLDIIFYLEKDKRLKDRPYHPYFIVLDKPDNEIARNKFYKIIQDIYPEILEQVKAEVENKMKDINYENKILDYRNSTYGIGTNAGHEQVIVSIGLRE